MTHHDRHPIDRNDPIAGHDRTAGHDHVAGIDGHDPRDRDDRIDTRDRGERMEGIARTDDVDIIDSIEDRDVRDAASGPLFDADSLDTRDTARRGIAALQRSVRANPLPMMAVAAGVGYLLQRTGLARVVVGTVLARALSHDGDTDDGRTTDEQRLLTWLNDAYALELAQIPILENHAEDAERHPHVREKDLEHLERTRKHAKKVKKCIEQLDGKASASKKAIGRLTGAINSVATEPFDDEIVKNFLADYATEHLEIASYRALIVTAKQAGHPKIARVCEEILEEEEEMALWLEKNLPYAVRETLHELGAAV